MSEISSSNPKSHSFAVEKFTANHLDTVRRKILSFFPNALVASTKNQYRILQKYNEYEQGYLKGGCHVYKKFKDLFRCSILIDDLRMETDVFRNLPVVEVKKKIDGNYKAFFIILNIDDWNVEVKVVKNIESIQESHEWYELRRSDGFENLDLFINRKLTHIVNNPGLLEDDTDGLLS